jgi:hypothetical protein
VSLKNQRATPTPPMSDAPCYLHSRAWGFLALTLRGEQIAAITFFSDLSLVDRFGLPRQFYRIPIARIAAAQAALRHAGELRSLVSQHADHDTVRIANEEATDAPRLVNWTVDDLVPGLYCFSMRRIDGCRRIDVHAHVGQHGLHTGRREEDLRLAGSEADVAAAEVPLLEPEHARIEGARGLEVR